ncbi:SCP2 sterol-binding domain-containing protein [Nocardia takedensis]
MAADLTPETTEDEFKQFVHAAGDADLEALMSDADLRPRLLARIFEIWSAGVLPKKTRRVDVVVRFRIGARPDVWDLAVVRGACTATAGETVARPEVTITVGDVAFLRLVARQANGVVLLASNKLHISGSIITAMKLDSWFD